MRSPALTTTAIRLRSAFLLTMAPLMLFGGADVHAGHRAAPPETPVFSDARHGGQASHWEAAETIVFPRCTVCLLTAQYHGLTARPAVGARCAPTGRAVSEAPATRLSPAAHRPARPRAPPSR